MSTEASTADGAAPAAQKPRYAVGIDFVSRQLAEGSFYKGKSLDQKLFTYNPREAYPDEVKWIMHQIE